MSTVIEVVEEIISNNENEDVSIDFFGKKYTIEELNSVEKEFNIKLPEDYKMLLNTYGQFDLTGPDTNIILFSLEEAFGNVLNPIDKLGHVLPFASDNGGNYYFYDIDNKSGKGSNSIFDVYPGNPDWKECTYLAKDMSELVKKIASGESFI